MKLIIDFIQQHPYFILSVFLLSLTGALAGSITVRNSTINRKISLWSLMGIVLIFLVMVVGSFSQSKESTKELMQEKSFGDEAVVLDGRRFVNCHFKGTQLILKGEAGFELESCAFEAITFAAQGPASETLYILHELYKVPEFRPIIEQTFIDIRKTNRSNSL